MKTKPKTPIPNNGRPKTYPWEKWFNGSTHKLRQGKDFTCSMRSMIVYTYSRARLLFYKVKVQEVSDSVLSITATAIPKVKGVSRAKGSRKSA